MSESVAVGVIFAEPVLGVATPMAETVIESVPVGV